MTHRPSANTKKLHLRSLLCAVIGIVVLSGCTYAPSLIPRAEQKPIDRMLVEYPAGFVLKQSARGLTAPTAICFVSEDGDYKNAMLIAESGIDGNTPRIYGYQPDGTFFNVYPKGDRIPTRFIPRRNRLIHAPIGGMIATQGKIFITHRDEKGRGVLSAISFNGDVTTVVANLPAQGDYSLTDLTVHPTTGRLYFGAGAATNSGVVGLDNWVAGWVKQHPNFCDLPNSALKLLGYKFFSTNPNAGFFGGADNVGTAPFQPFSVNNQLRIRPANDSMPTSAIYSISPSGGDLRVEAWGIRLPRGLAFNEFANLYSTNDGMELRGTRPVKDDPDALLKVIPNTWYGFPDFSTDLTPISDPRFQPSPELMARTGYPELSFLIDHASSGLSNPASYRDTLLFGVFPSLSGAAKLDFAPAGGAFRDFRGNAIVAMSGDRAPFSTSGQKLRQPVGYKVMRVDLDAKRVDDFIRNTEDVPSSISKSISALERPVDVKFGPDGRLYILDFGQMKMRDGRERVVGGSGRIFVLEPVENTRRQ